jgi:hypothetical protein
MLRRVVLVRVTRRNIPVTVNAVKTSNLTLQCKLSQAVILPTSVMFVTNSSLGLDNDQPEVLQIFLPPPHKDKFLNSI